MKKKMVTVWSKRVLALALSFVLVTPVALSGLNNVVAEADEVPTPLMKVGFDEGFKGESEQKDKDGNVVTKNNGFEVVESEPVLNYQCEETKVDEVSTIYDYDFTSPLYQGTGADAEYHKVITGNTPTTEYDEKMGHVLWMQYDCAVEEFIKTKPAAYTNEETGELLTEINSVLDKAYPPYTPEYDENGVETEASLKAKEAATLQKYYEYYPEVKVSNPFAGLTDAKAVTINYWLKLTADAENTAISENTVVINVKKSASLQYPAGSDVTAIWPTKQDSTIPYGFANGFLQISADGSMIFTEDDGTSLDQNKSSATYGQVIDFNEANNFSAKGSDKVLSDILKPEEWHMVTLEITNESVKTYYDGKLSDVEINAISGSAFNNGSGYGVVSENTADTSVTSGLSLVDWVVSADAVSVGGCNAAYTTALGFDANVTPFMVDDLSFYGEALTEAQLTALYNEGSAKMAGQDIPKPTVIKFDSSDVFDISMASNNPKKDKVEAPTLTNDMRMGSVLKTFASKSQETSGAKLANPFAGKELSGATISYWMKAEASETDKKGVVTYSSTAGVSFIDAPKELYHSKMQEATKYTKASTVLYGMTDGFATFSEGYTDVKVPETLKNQFSRSLEAEAATKMLENNDGDWHLYTLVVTNKEIKYYVDGVILEDVSIDRGPRFFDGYYQKTRDIADNNATYGGAGNHGATALLTFLTYEDTSMYVAYINQNKSASTYQQCADAYFGEIACYDAALTDEQVASIYNEQLEKYPEVTVVLGDANGDTNINAQDALVILKHAAKMSILEGDAAIAADANKDGKINSTDALAVLKHAANIEKLF